MGGEGGGRSRQGVWGARGEVQEMGGERGGLYSFLPSFPAGHGCPPHFPILPGSSALISPPPPPYRLLCTV